jgi:site-specific DNA-methyltransferase (adenine-specific)
MTETSSEPLLLLGDCLDRLREMPDNSVDSVVTDPPYGLSFMGKKWDYDVPSEEIWRECLRVLKPGGHLLAFAGTRTQHRMAVRIEDAGFEIRDMIAWVYGSGFPKSLDVSKAIDKAAGAEREVVGQKVRGDVEKAKASGSTYAAAEANKNNKAIFGYGVENITSPATPEAQQWLGWGTALKPALEPITVARKPLGEKTVAANVLAHGTGAINVDGCRVGTDGGTRKSGPPSYKTGTSLAGSVDGSLNGGGCEPINAGRWPSNLIHDGSDEVVELFPDSGAGNGKGAYSYAGTEYHNKDTSIFNGDKPQAPSNFNDSGSAARFFYCAKASKKDRDEGCEGLELNARGRTCYDSQYHEGGGKLPPRSGNNHPTVKPTALMRYLCRLVTPPGGIVLDPFMGSGSTGKAAMLEGFQFIGIERDEEYMEIAKARISAASNEHT